MCTVHDDRSLSAERFKDVCHRFDLVPLVDAEILVVQFHRLISGPIILKTVGTFRSFLTFMICLIFGWTYGANKNAMPMSLIWSEIFPGEYFICRPRDDKTSELPVRLVILLLPCFAILTLAPAMTNADVVEILKLCEPSPPVPQLSMTFGMSCGSFVA